MSRIKAPFQTVFDKVPSAQALRRLAQGAGLASVVLGCSVLLGWTLDSPILKSVVPGLATMKVNTASAIALVGLSLALFASGVPEGWRKFLGLAAACLAVALAATTLVEHALHVDVGIDQLVLVDSAPSEHLGRMAPLTAVDLLLLGCAMLCLEVRTRSGQSPAQLLALSAVTIPFVSVIGYAYGVVALDRLASFTSMALHTSLGFVLLGIGVLCARPDHGIAGALLSTGPGGVLARRLMPGVFLFPVALGWLRLEGQRLGYYGTQVGTGLLVIAIAIGLAILASATALRIDATDSEHQRAERKVLESEARKRAILDAALDAIITIDGTGRIVEFNPTAERFFDCSAAEAVGQEMAELIVPPDLRDAHRKGLQRVVASGQGTLLGRRIEMPALRKDGSIFPVELSITRINTPGPQLFTGYLRDISDRKQADADLRKSEERFRLLASATSDVVWDWDLVANSVWWNEGVFKLFGYDAAAANANSDWWSRHVEPEDVPRVVAGIDQALAGPGTYWEEDYRFRRADGSIAFVRDSGFIIRDPSGKAIRMVGATVDTTERKELEDQLRQAQKMEAIGQLAGGIAHDFNNLLTAILGYTELIHAAVRRDPAVVEHVSEVRKASERAASLTRQLLAFSRKQVLELQVLDLNAVVRNVESMLQRLIGEQIDLVTTLDPCLDRVMADAGQIEQVIVNLVVNARDAMPDGGRLTVETANVVLDEEYVRNHTTARPGPHVLVAVTDTGSGMDLATQARIFEPFFTTKGKDKGTGLGLSTTYGIVKQSGGNIWFYSEKGKGTTFKVYLPRADAPISEPDVSHPKEAPTSAGETVLLVEDDPSLRKLARTILSVLGYKILEAATGEEGVRVAADYDGRIDLVLTDVVMPGVSGSEVVRRVQERRPDVAVLYMSGYADDAVVRHGVLSAGAAFLQKPFTLTALGQKLRSVLRGKE